MKRFLNSVLVARFGLPLLLVAGAIEAFISPSNMPGGAKALLGLSLAVVLLGYIVARGQPGMSTPETTSGDR